MTPISTLKAVHIKLLLINSPYNSYSISEIDYKRVNDKNI